MQQLYICMIWGGVFMKYTALLNQHADCSIVKKASLMLSHPVRPKKSTSTC